MSSTPSAPFRRLLAYSLLVVLIAAAVSSGGTADAETTVAVHLPLVMMNTPSMKPSSYELIELALANGAIDEEAALTYQVYAAFGDPRLPALYHGDDRLVEDTPAVADLRARIGTLSPGTRQLLAPFLLPPPAPGSWLEVREDTAAAGGLTAAAVEWHSLSTANGKVRVWYEQRYAGTGMDDVKAAGLVSALDTLIWSKLTGLMGREPLSDIGQPNNGGDGRLDIYLVHIDDRGVTSPYTACENSPVHLLINSDRPLGDARTPGIVQTTTHELMHAIQFTYDVAGACSEYDWWAEASAKWSEDYVYPLANSEQPYAWPFLSTPELPLENLSDSRHYGAYLLPFYLARSLEGPGVVRQIWENDTAMDSLAAIDSAVAGGFEQTWPEFAARNWNRPPVDDYKTWDGLAQGAEPVLSSATEVKLNGAPDGTYTMGASVEHLSALYYHFTFTDDNVRSVTFYNGFTFQLDRHDVTEAEAGASSGQTVAWTALPAEQTKGARVEALIKIAGHPDWEPVQDWTDDAFQYFCRDQADQRLEELVIIYSNSEYQDRNWTLQPQGTLTPQLWVTDIGCWRWEGSAGSTGTLEMLNASVTTTNDTGNVVWERAPLVPTANSDGSLSLPYLSFKPLSGALSYRQTGEWYPGCSAAASATVPLTAERGELMLFSFMTAGAAHQAYRGTSNVGPVPAGICTDPSATGEGGIWFNMNPYSGPLYQVRNGGLLLEEAWAVTLSGSAASTHWSLMARREP
ncbi:MAG: hypothetical protein ACYC5O_15185 [Anaerolineae bacterium]